MAMRSQLLLLRRSLCAIALVAVTGASDAGSADARPADGIEGQPVVSAVFASADAVAGCKRCSYFPLGGHAFGTTTCQFGGECFDCDSDDSGCHGTSYPGSCAAHPHTSCGDPERIAVIEAIDARDIARIAQLATDHPRYVHINHARGLIQFTDCRDAVIAQHRLDSVLLALLD